MRFVSSVQTASILFSFLFSSSISALQPSEHRSYFSTVIQSNNVYIIGGSNNTLQVPILNFTYGIDIHAPNWQIRTGPSPTDHVLKPFTYGVAFQGAKNQVFVQGGEGTSREMQNLMKYTPAIDGWEYVYQEAADRPAPQYLMTASVNPSTNMAYYYGGQPTKLGASASNDFTSFDTNTGKWTKLSPLYPKAHRPGRSAHSSNIINNRVFIMGGLTDSANATLDRVLADFKSVLIYDIASNTAVSIATLGDIPDARLAYSTALGLDNRSIVIYGGYYYHGKSGLFQAASNDVYILDTCTLTWRKQPVTGTSSPGSLYGHNAVNINNYMVLLMGMTNEVNYNENIYILDMNQWKWVDKIDTQNRVVGDSDTIALSSTCQFPLPSVNSTDFYPLDYDFSVLDNPLRSMTSNSKNHKGLIIGLCVTAILLLSIGGAYMYVRRIRKNARRLNPRWMRPIPPSGHHHDSHDVFGDERDYPLFVYNKELDNNRAGESYKNQVHEEEVKIYTAADHEQWEQQSQNKDDIWKRMKGLNHHSSIPK
ncbi:uncharacterized protein BX663DRAFT_492727 [Cokeromyces recurvatus]|uniref:uncharacterized protein n=1 Tax=Cokeromyces recurvatus TaxID=90255 RepID=UPI00221EB961|nr:uncharacterized protein BX663DRAFT_492727 [Cokeromyces recurvatus]KAI7908016.1 hypothetical protein BX663DRAFT_492727 [Cokeromyces recurvatus]